MTETQAASWPTGLPKNHTNNLIFDAALQQTNQQQSEQTNYAKISAPQKISGRAIVPIQEGEKQKLKKKSRVAKIWNAIKEFVFNKPIKKPDLITSFAPSLSANSAANLSVDDKMKNLAALINNPLKNLKERQMGATEYGNLLFDLSKEKPILDIPFFILSAARHNKVPLKVDPIPEYLCEGPFFDQAFIDPPDSMFEILQGISQIAELANQIADTTDDQKADDQTQIMYGMISKLRRKTAHFIKNMNNPQQARKDMTQIHLHMLACLHGNEPIEKVRYSIATEALKDGLTVRVKGIYYNVRLNFSELQGNTTQN